MEAAAAGVPGHPNDTHEPKGTPPPRAPRTIPADFVQRSAGPELRRIGLFAAVAGFFFLIGLGVVLAGNGTGFIFMVFTAPMGVAVGNEARKVLSAQKVRKRIFEYGIAATGTVHTLKAVATDMRDEGYERWSSKDFLHEVTWSYRIGDSRFSGGTKVASPNVAHLAAGDPIWVLVDPNDHTMSMEWPIGFIHDENTLPALGTATAPGAEGSPLSAHVENQNHQPTGTAPPLAPRPTPADAKLRSYAILWIFVLAFGALGCVVLYNAATGFAAGDFGALGSVVFAIAPLAVAGTCGYYAFRRTVVRKPVYANGMAMAAVVTGRERHKVFARADVITWSYTVNGQQFEGKAQAQRSLTRDIGIGDPIWVLVDQADLTKSVEWPAGFRSGEPATPPSYEIVEPTTPGPGPAPRNASGSNGVNAWVAVELFIGSLCIAMSALFVYGGVRIILDGGDWFFAIFGIVFSAFALMFLRSGIEMVASTVERRFLRRHLYSHGIATPAVVDEFIFGQRKGDTLRWSYEVDGQRYRGSIVGRTSTPDAFKPGDAMWVVVDPNDPSKSAEWPALFNARR